MYVCRKNKVENKFKVKLQTNILKQATKTLLKSKTITAGCVNEAKGWLKGMRQMPELCAKYRKNWSGKFEFWSGKSQGKVREFCFTQIVDTLNSRDIDIMKYVLTDGRMDEQQTDTIKLT